MTGTLVNVVAILAGSFIGLLIGRKLPERFIKIVFQAIGLFTLFLGISMSLETGHVFLILISLLLGAAIGELAGIESLARRFADKMKRWTGKGNDRFSEGLVTAFLLYCMGSVTILGAIDEGLRNNPNLLLIKSLMDGISSIALASTMGIGVAFSVIPLLVYQGGITIFASYVGDYFTETLVTELTATGGVLLIGLGLQILEIKSLRILNMIPSVLVIVLLVYLFG